MRSASKVELQNFLVRVTKPVAKELLLNGTIPSEHAVDMVRSERRLSQYTELVWDVNRNTLHLVNIGRGIELDADNISALMMLPHEVRQEFARSLTNGIK